MIRLGTYRQIAYCINESSTLNEGFGSLVAKGIKGGIKFLAKPFRKIFGLNALKANKLSSKNFKSAATALERGNKSAASKFIKEGKKLRLLTGLGISTVSMLASDNLGVFGGGVIAATALNVNPLLKAALVGGGGLYLFNKSKEAKTNSDEFTKNQNKLKDVSTNNDEFIKNHTPKQKVDLSKTDKGAEYNFDLSTRDGKDAINKPHEQNNKNANDNSNGFSIGNFLTDTVRRFNNGIAGGINALGDTTSDGINTISDAINKNSK